MNLTPQQGYEKLQADPDAALIDIRSSMEFLFVGHPVGAIHIPWIDEPDWEINPNFAEEIRKAMLRIVKDEDRVADSPVILICRSGVRSLQAKQKLEEAGFTNVSHISEGFEGDLNENHQRSTVGGWRFRGLPWEQC